MNKLLLILSVSLISFGALASENLNEEKVRSVMKELSEAIENYDIDSIKKYVDSESKFIWTTSIEGGKDGKELNGDDWLEFMAFLAPLSKGGVGKTVSEITSITIDRGSNQATVVEDIKSVSSVFGESYEEQATETNIFGIRNGSIKIIYSERNTKKMTELK